MNADQVRAYVTAKWPTVLQSPLAQAMHGASALAALEASDADAVVMRADAMGHALQCIDACEAEGVAFDEETLSFNIETSFPDLDSDACDEVAREAISRAR